MWPFKAFFGYPNTQKGRKLEGRKLRELRDKSLRSD